MTVLPAESHPDFASTCAAHPLHDVLLYSGIEWRCLIVVPRHHPKTGKPQHAPFWRHGDVIDVRLFESGA